MLKIIYQSKKSKARLGALATRRGVLKTPFFMPIATKGAVKALSSDDIKALKPQIVLANTYHLMLRPGADVLKRAKGLHAFMQWKGPILTDSGGFQVFSLGLRHRHSPLESSGTSSWHAAPSEHEYGKDAHYGLVKITDQGVEFRSHIDGAVHFMSPEDSLKMQDVIGSDIRMVLDVCSQHSCSYEQAERDVALTSAWAKRSKAYCVKQRYTKAGAFCETPLPPLTFAIVQGSRFQDLRQRSAKELAELDFDGYAIGGVAVGESEAEMLRAIENTVGAFRGTPLLPDTKPRYLMGVGYPHQIVEAVKRGIDMFDCVIPTREARHGRLYQFVGTRHGVSLRGKKFYKTLIITKSAYKKDMTPINPSSKLPLLQKYSKAYLRHLFDVQEPLALTLATLNNVEFYGELMRCIRAQIRKGEM